MEFEWIKKENTPSKADVSIVKGQQNNRDCIRITFRNGVYEDFPTGFVRLGFSQDGKCLGFMNAKPSTAGWRICGSGNTRNIMISDKRAIDGLFRFLGDYEMEIDEQNRVYIDRRHIKDV